jgi:hypothetical protein
MPSDLQFWEQLSSDLTLFKKTLWSGVTGPSHTQRVAQIDPPQCTFNCLGSHTIFWDITPCSPLKIKRRFGGTYRLHLQGRKISTDLLVIYFLARPIFRPWRWMRYVPPKRQLTLNRKHGVSFLCSFQLTPCAIPAREREFTCVTQTVRRDLLILNTI